MKRIFIVAIVATMLLCGCQSQISTSSAPEVFGEGLLTGWTLSEDASYSINPILGTQDGLMKTDKFCLTTGEVKPAYELSENCLNVERYFPMMETDSYWRGLFFTTDTMVMESEKTASATITVDVGKLAGICVGTDQELNNGYMAALDLASQSLNIYRVNQGIITALDKYQEGVSTKAVQVEFGATYELSVTYAVLDENSFQMVVALDGEQLLNTTLSGYGVPEGRGSQVSLVASDMECSFENVVVDGATIDLSTLKASDENARVVDGKFRGEINSDPFVINSRLLCFKVGGGQDKESLTVSLVDAKTNEVLLSETGSGSDEMIRYAWVVDAHKGKECFIRIKDASRSSYLNVDSFFSANVEPLDLNFSLLNSQIGYSLSASKKAYIRAPEGKSLSQTNFVIRDYATWESVYEGSIETIGTYWESEWWLLNFTDLNIAGEYIITVGDNADCLVSTAFSVGEATLLNESLIDASLNQLDLRRSPNKIGWRDSSTDGLRELHAQVMTVHTMLDMLEMQEQWLSAYNRARVIDNLQFGLSYILTAQEKTDDPLTNGRFIHDLYPSEYSAHNLRTWHDTAYAMTALARAYPVLQDLGFGELAAQTKDAFDLSFDMCVLRPYYLEEEFNVEDENGYSTVVSAMREHYYIKNFTWTFSKELRTRDKMMFLRACTYMAKADSDPRYLEEAKKWAKEVSDAQFTDYQNSIDGAYGCFYEFENNTEAMMLEWIQAPNLLLGNQTPTDLSSFVDLLELAPTDPDAAMWYNTIVTYAEDYLKTTAELTPLGIYPIAAFNNEEQRGVRFFQMIAHGASSHYGLSARNIQLLAGFLGDTSLSELAQNNIQFQAGLNPGFPTNTEHEQWKSYSLLYLIGDRYFSGYFNGGAYCPPLGSGLNGFSASVQFNPKPIDQEQDMPLGILDANGGYQFNEDYLTHGMGYSSGVAAVESQPVISVKTTFNGQPVVASINVSEYQSASVSTNEQGEASLVGIPANKMVTLEFEYQGIVTKRTLAVIPGTAKTIEIDFAEAVQASLIVPEKLSGNGKAVLTLSNQGANDTTVTVWLCADGVSLGMDKQEITVKAGQTFDLEIDISSEGQTIPYLVYVHLVFPNTCNTVVASGVVE